MARNGFVHRAADKLKRSDADKFRRTRIARLPGLNAENKSESEIRHNNTLPESDHRHMRHQGEMIELPGSGESHDPAERIRRELYVGISEYKPRTCCYLIRAVQRVRFPQPARRKIADVNYT